MHALMQEITDKRAAGVNTVIDRALFGRFTLPKTPLGKEKALGIK